MKKAVSLLALAVTASIAFAGMESQAVEQPLFSPIKSKAALNDRVYRTVSADRSTLSLQLVNADATQIDVGTQTLSLGSFGTAYLKDSYRTPNGNIVWNGTIGRKFGKYEQLREKLTGETADDPLNSVLIVRSGNKLTGTIRVKGREYELDSLPSGGHVLALVDSSKRPKEGVPKADGPQNLPMGGQRKAAANAVSATAIGTTAVNVVRVMVVWSGPAANKVDAPASVTDYAMALINRTATNSNTNVQFELAGHFVAWNYTNDPNYGTERDRFINTTDGYLDNYAAKRDEIKADIVVVVSDSGQNCGAAGLKTTAAGAVAVVNALCMKSGTFSHEIGHLFGAQHEKEASNNPYYDYGYGHYSPSKTWRTVLSYGCPITATGCPRIEYYSNPNISYNGVPTGTATANNARVMRGRGAEVAAFR